jgi:hypothetical protein
MALTPSPSPEAPALAHRPREGKNFCGLKAQLE